MLGFITRFFNKDCQKCKDLARPIEVKQVSGMEFVEIRKLPPKNTFDELLVINAKGWKKLCHYIAGKFYFHDGAELTDYYPNFHPTHYCVLDLPEEIKEKMREAGEYYGT